MPRMTKGEASAMRLCMICGNPDALLIRLPDGRSVRGCEVCLRGSNDWISWELREPIGREAEYEIEEAR